MGEESDAKPEAKSPDVPAWLPLPKDLRDLPECTRESLALADSKLDTGIKGVTAGFGAAKKGMGKGHFTVNGGTAACRVDHAKPVLGSKSGGSCTYTAPVVKVGAIAIAIARRKRDEYDGAPFLDALQDPTLLYSPSRQVLVEHGIETDVPQPELAPAEDLSPKPYRPPPQIM